MRRACSSPIFSCSWWSSTGRSSCASARAADQTIARTRRSASTSPTRSFRHAHRRVDGGAVALCDARPQGHRQRIDRVQAHHRRHHQGVRRARDPRVPAADELGRGYLLIALPTGLALLLASRWLWRQWLNRRRAAGEFSYRAILMGERASRRTSPGRSPVTPATASSSSARSRRAAAPKTLAPGVPVLGTYDRAIEAIDASEADTVVFTGADTISPRQLRQFGWDLESRSVNLIVAPALTDVAGPRIHARPVAGLPLIHVDYPVFEGRKYAAKRAFDLIASFALLVLLSPLFLVLDDRWCAATARGPALPPGARRAQRATVQDAQVPLDGGRRRGAARRACSTRARATG